MSIILESQSISKRFGNRQVLENITFNIKQGEAVALLGPNGAGKSTTLSILQGLRPASGGSVTLFGESTGSAGAMRRTGVTPQEADFPPQMSPRELIAFTHAHFGRSTPVDELVEAFGLERLIDRRIAGFSGGERRRVALALAFAGKPELVFLDEPTNGLDITAQAAFNRFCRRFADNGGTLLLTSHNLAEIEFICERVMLIDEGRIALDGPIQAIRSAVGAKSIRFASDKPGELTRQTCESANGFWRVTTREPDALIRKLLTDTPDLSGLTIENLPLDEAIALARTQNPQTGA